MMRDEEATDIYSLGEPNTYNDPVTTRILSDLHEGRILPAPNSIVLAGEALGAEADWISAMHAVSRIDGKEILFSANHNVESIVGGAILRDKDLTRRLLESSGVPVAEGSPVRTAEEAIAFQRQLDSPVVVKPRFGNRGRGVSVGLVTPQEITEAFHRASEIGPVIVERDLQGVAEYRCLTTPDRCVSVVRRILPWVEGDGESTIDELVDARNEFRATVPSTIRRYIPKDAETESTLRRQGYDLASVLEAGVRVTVRGVGGLSSGGEPEECSDKVSDLVKQVAKASAGAIPGLGWCGSDIMVDGSGNAYVIEINTEAGTLGASYPFYGEPAPVASVIYDMRSTRAPKAPTTPPAALGDLHPVAPRARVDTKRGSGRSLFSLLRDRLEEEGGKVEDIGRSVTKVTFPDGRVEWFAGTATVDDLSAVRGTAQRHSLARRLIRRSGLPIVPAVASARSERIERFRAKAPGGEVVMVPARGRWGRRSLRTVASLEEIETAMGTQRRSWLAQQIVVGERLQVFASPWESLAVFGEGELSRKELQAVSDLAVQAVRAVPELRWACVDIVVPVKGQTRSSPLVEGIEFDPWIWDSQILLAGSIESALSVILGREDAREEPASRDGQ